MQSLIPKSAIVTLLFIGEFLLIISAENVVAANVTSGSSFGNISANISILEGRAHLDLMTVISAFMQRVGCVVGVLINTSQNICTQSAINDCHL